MGIDIPGCAVPNNLHLDPSLKIALVDGDLYGICDRIKEEVSPDLYIVQAIDDEQGKCSYTVMEKCEDGTDRLVFKADEIDQRIIEKLKYMLDVPFEQRWQKIADEIDANEAQRKADDSEEFYERMGAPMLAELGRTGFIQRKESYRKRTTPEKNKRGKLIVKGD